MGILVNSEKGKKPVSIRVLAVVCLSLLTVIVIASYLGYSTIMELQTEQSNLQMKYDNLISQCLALQTNFNEVQNSSNDLQLKLT